MGKFDNRKNVDILFKRSSRFIIKEERIRRAIRLYVSTKQTYFVITHY